VCAEEGDRIALTKCAEQMMHALSAYTPRGHGVAMDARLRPRGGEGELLSTSAQLRRIRARGTSLGSPDVYLFLRIGPRVERRDGPDLNKLFERFAADPSLPPSGRECGPSWKRRGDRKSSVSAGAIYDVDFMI